MLEIHADKVLTRRKTHTLIATEAGVVKWQTRFVPEAFSWLYENGHSEARLIFHDEVWIVSFRPAPDDQEP